MGVVSARGAEGLFLFGGIDECWGGGEFSFRGRGEGEERGALEEWRRMRWANELRVFECGFRCDEE